MHPQLAESFEFTSVSETNQVLHRLSYALMQAYITNANLMATYNKFSSNTISGEFQIRTAEIRRLEEKINSVIARHQIKCPHCWQVTVVAFWVVSRGCISDVGSLDIKCPRCSTPLSLDSEYGESIKMILSRAYMPTTSFFVW